MATLELERERRDAEVEGLERLWTAPAAPRSPRRRVPALRRLDGVVVVGWAAALVARR